MTEATMRGADVLVRALATQGTARLFTLSGNQIMPVFDACIGTGIDLIHVRHEAAAVHMADAWGRLTGEPGVALVTAGPGFANTLSALYVAKMAESPLGLLSGHAPRNELGRGPFQEMAQAEMAGHVTKASWTAAEGARLGHDVARAFQVASSGRPGPVHVALPVDLLEAAAGHPEDPAPGPDGLSDSTEPLEPAVAAQVLDALAEASRPLILVGPAMERGRGPEITSSLADVMGVPVVGMDGPRGANDPARGALAEVLAQADLILLLGKHLDFTLRSGEPPVISPACRFVHLDPDLRSLEQTRRIAQAPRLVLTAIADPLPAARQITRLGSGRKRPASSWSDEVRAAISYRPPGWSDEEPASEGPIHPRNVLRAVQELLDSRPDSVLISDGGEFGQWARACLSAPHSLINGLSGAIGSAVPFALAARIAFPGSIVVTVLGDGTFGFHPSEFDTAVRYMLPFIAVVGNDAAWNAEYQIQLREYGEDRLVGCELLPSRYDEVVTALGGHGEHVQSAGDLRPALERALRSSLPSCVNVSISRNAAPVVRRTP